MIITQTVVIDGVSYARAYSDARMLIERDGALYEEAIDPIDNGRTYTESDQPIPDEKDGYVITADEASQAYEKGVNEA